MNTLKINRCTEANLEVRLVLELDLKWAPLNSPKWEAPKMSCLA